jgi:hypothetical protein
MCVIICLFSWLQVVTGCDSSSIAVWDIKEHICLQTVVLKFPSSIHGRMPEHGPFPMHLRGAPQNVLLVTCNDYFGMLTLGRTGDTQTHGAVTHDTQLCCAIYNDFFKQVRV